ncbi:hypothetical protein CRUP_027155, partial [Coryphaenoides rupestris]
ILELVLENFVYPWYRDITDDEAFVDELRVTLRFFAAVLVRRTQKVDVASLITRKLLKVSMKHIEVISKARQRVARCRAMGFIRVYLQKMRHGVRLEVLRELARQYPVFCFTLVILLLSTVLLNRYLHILMVFWSFLAGVVTFYCSLGPESLLPNVFISIRPKIKSYQQELFPLGHSCAVCGKIKCKRHRPTLLLENYQPWLDLQVPSKVDVSLSEILELVLENFVYPWYRDITDDEAFVDELRVTLRFFAAVLNSEYLQQAALEEYGPDLHMALRSRRDELLYLRRLPEILFPYILPPKALDCRSLTLLFREVLAGSVFLPAMDYLADPPEEPPEPTSALVPFLQRYADPRNNKPSEFNDKILCPELSDAEKVALHAEVQKIYTTYCLDESVDKIRFDSFIVEEIRNMTRNTSKRGESFGISKIGSKIKGVFKSTTMEGAMLPSYGLVEGEDDMDDSPVEAVSTPSTPRNLSAWTISIPYVDFYDDEVKRERVPVFCIDVERNDRKAVGHETESWSVYRRYLEFYVLESKLTEFHGSFPDAQLPSKRIIGPKNYEFLTSKREDFQEYLQHPELINSQLLADFLSPHSMESQFLDKMLPDVNLGKIIKSVPSKLIKEKGQHLEPFIQSFFNSCESPKPKPSRPELTILSPTSENDKKLFNDIFKNNANRSEATEKRHNQNYFMEMITVEGVYDYLMYVGRVVFRIPDWLHHLLMGARILAKNTLEAYVDHYLGYKLGRVPRCAQDRKKRAKKSFEEMMSFIPDFLTKCIGEEAKYDGVRLLFDGLQQPVLNKQLTYVLLDIAIQELFPELNKIQKEASVVTPWM